VLGNAFLNVIMGSSPPRMPDEEPSESLAQGLLRDGDIKDALFGFSEEQGKRERRREEEERTGEKETDGGKGAHSVPRSIAPRGMSDEEQLERAMRLSLEETASGGGRGEKGEKAESVSGSPEQTLSTDSQGSRTPKVSDEELARELAAFRVTERSRIKPPDQPASQPERYSEKDLLFDDSEEESTEEDGGDSDNEPEEGEEGEGDADGGEKGLKTEKGPPQPKGN
jgi:hypothetical protein